MFIHVPSSRRHGGRQHPPKAAVVTAAVGGAVALALVIGIRSFSDKAHDGGPGFLVIAVAAMVALLAVGVAVVARVRADTENREEDRTDASHAAQPAHGEHLADAAHPGESASDADEQRPIALAVIAAIVAIFVIVALLVGWSRPAAAQGASAASEDRGAFAMLRGADTIVVERFIRTATALQGSLDIKGAPHVEYFASLGAGNLVQSFTLKAWAPGTAADAPPAQTIGMLVRGDTMIAQTPAGVQRVPTQYGAVPVINNSLALTEIFTRRARAAGGTGVFPWLAVAGGMTISVTVAPIGGDSLLLTVANQPHRLAVDALGRINGGSIPGAGIAIVRLGPDAAAGMTLTPPPDIALTKPDYSAPAGAPYTAEEVMFAGPGGIRLGGTLTKPRGTGSFPAVITISGSGQQDRDEFIPLAGGVRLFRAIADTLSRRGIAVLRVDDRGVGASGGNATISTTADFADDTRSAVAYLRTRPDIDAARIALLGHSEGGIIAPMVAATDAKLGGIIVLAGPASRGSDISKAQNRYAVDHATSLTQHERDSIYAWAVAQIDNAPPSSVPWVRFFWSYDPAPAARKVKAPTLIVQGATDRQVPKEEAERLASLIREGGNRDVTLRILPNVNHLFLDDPDGNFSNYNKLPSNRISTAALGAIADWTAIKLGARPTP